MRRCQAPLFPTGWPILSIHWTKKKITFGYGIFQTDQISGLYLDNFGGYLTEIVFIYFNIYLITVIFSRRSGIEKFVGSISGTAQAAAFMFLISNVLGQMQRQVLFTMVQIINSGMGFDSYSKASIALAYLTLPAAIGLLVYCFLRARMIYRGWENETVVKGKKIYSQDDYKSKWMEKKYGFMFEDFKTISNHRFFFGFWLCAISILYILLILIFQCVPILQCLSILFPLVGIIVFAVRLKPFMERLPSFLFFFNFSCGLAVAFINFILAIIEQADSEFSGLDSLGWVIASVIIVHLTVNAFLSIGRMALEISKKIKRLKLERKTYPEIFDSKTRTFGKSRKTTLKTSQIVQVSNFATILDQADFTPTITSPLSKRTTFFQNLTDQSPSKITDQSPILSIDPSPAIIQDNSAKPRSDYKFGEAIRSAKREGLRSTRIIPSDLRELQIEELTKIDGQEGVVSPISLGSGSKKD